MHGLFGFLISSWLQIYQGMFQYFEKYFYKKKIEKFYKILCKLVKIWRNYGHEFVASLFWHTLYNKRMSP